MARKKLKTVDSVDFTVKDLLTEFNSSMVTKIENGLRLHTSIKMNMSLS